MGLYALLEGFFFSYRRGSTGVSMQFVIASPQMFLTNRARQPSDGLTEQDISKTGVRAKYMEDEVLSKAQRCSHTD